MVFFFIHPGCSINVYHIKVLYFSNWWMEFGYRNVPSKFYAGWADSMSFPGGVWSGVSSGQFQAASKQWTFTISLETWAVSHVRWQGVWMVLCTQTTRERRDSVLSRKHFDKRCVSFCVIPWAFHGECDWMYTKFEFCMCFTMFCSTVCYFFFAMMQLRKQKSQVLHELSWREWPWIKSWLTIHYRRTCENKV